MGRLLVVDTAIYEDEDGAVLWRDREGRHRTAGTLIVGVDGRLYLIVHVARLLTDRSERLRVRLQPVE